jgi:hypothetical protein
MGAIQQAPVRKSYAGHPPSGRRSAISSRPGGTRTPNPRFWRPVLYHLSYGPGSLLPERFSAIHGQGRNRTADTTIFSRVLYQLSYLAPTGRRASNENRPTGARFGRGRRSFSRKLP